MAAPTRPRDRPRRRRRQAADAADRRTAPSPPCPSAASTGWWTSRCRNIVNSRYLHVVVLTQYKSHSLDRHISKTWRMSPLLGNYVAPCPRSSASASTGTSAAPTRSTSASTSSRTSVPTSSSWSAPTTSTAWTSRRWWTRTSSRAPSSRSPASGSRSPWPTSSASSTSTPTTPPRSARSSRSRPTRVGLADSPGEVLASMGNYVFNADALVEAVTKDADDLDSRHDMGGDIVPYFVDRGHGRRLRLHPQRRARLHRPRPRLLARRRDHRLVLRRPQGPHRRHPGLQPLQLRVAAAHRATPGCRRPSSCTPGRGAWGTRPTRSSRPACSSRARRSRARCSPPACTCTPGRPCRDSVLLDDVQVHRHAQVHRAIVDKNVIVDGARPRSASTRARTARAASR